MKLKESEPMEKLKVGLLNDSFPPAIDGVANVTVNYAKIINSEYGEAVVATPFYPDVTDNYPFKVYRYPSIYVSDQIGYRAGYPFDVKVLYQLEREGLDIIHTHCPFVSTVLARMLRSITGTPIVFTYHTKFDIDIEKALASDSLRRASIKFIVSNISACDDVWVVSEGAGENLRSLGYKGEYTVMENGVDFKLGRSPKERVDALRERYGIGEDETVFLFVGRMMWYKGVQLSLDGLKRIKEKGKKFRFFLVGDGVDAKDIKEYVKKIGLEENCVFTGSVLDRELLRDYFTMSDLFLFPSTFDTNGIVVREAAACYCPSLLLKGSCAAEGIEDGVTGLIIPASVDGMELALQSACEDRQKLKEIGENAAEKIYISWEDALKKVTARYREIIARNKVISNPPALQEDINAAIELLNVRYNENKDLIQELIWDTRDWIQKLGLGDESFTKVSREFVDLAKERIETVVERDGRRRKIITGIKKNRRAERKAQRKGQDLQPK